MKHSAGCVRRWMVQAVFKYKVHVGADCVNLIYKCKRTPLPSCDVVNVFCGGNICEIYI